jgi:hypothetical protein
MMIPGLTMMNSLCGKTTLSISLAMSLMSFRSLVVFQSSVRSCSLIVVFWAQAGFVKPSHKCLLCVDELHLYHDPKQDSSIKYVRLFEGSGSAKTAKGARVFMPLTEFEPRLFPPTIGAAVALYRADSSSDAKWLLFDRHGKSQSLPTVMTIAQKDSQSDLDYASKRVAAYVLMRYIDSKAHN